MMAIVGQLTLPGTIRIVIVPMVFDIPFAWLLLLLGRRWTRRSRPIRLAAYGLADSESNIPGPNSDLGRRLFVPVVVVFGVVVGFVGERLLGRTRGMPAAS